MSNDARRKEKQRLKREKKKAALRRSQSVSPYKRIGQLGEVEACYINSDWQEKGLASIHVIRRNPAGGHAMGCFLVDVWCAGLKGAWGRIDLMQEDIDHALGRARENFELTRIDVETVRKLVAGAVRFARQNGFRLPARYERWIHLLGGIGEVSAADLSAFGKDGKLFWIGSLDDLGRRLIGCTPQEFFARPDVEYLAEVPGPREFEPEEEDEDDDDERFEQLVDSCEKIFDEAVSKAARFIRSECEAAGEQPEARLDDAACLLMARQIFKDKPLGEHSDITDAMTIVIKEAVDELGILEAEENKFRLPEQLSKAVAQATRFLFQANSTGSEVQPQPQLLDQNMTA